MDFLLNKDAKFTREPSQRKFLQHTTGAQTQKTVIEKLNKLTRGMEVIAATMNAIKVTRQLRRGCKVTLKSKKQLIYNTNRDTHAHTRVYLFINICL